MSDPRKILVVANETVTGQPLIDAVKRRADGGPISVHVICPQNQPKHGYVIYDDTIRGAAENRLAMTLAQLREVGIEATGDVEDPDPYSAIMDAVVERDYDEIVISTHPIWADGGPISVHVICPQNQPKHGYVIYDDTIRGAAENRLAMTLAQLREVGIEATGDVEDPDPYSAIMDAVGERDYDEIVISTH